MVLTVHLIKLDARIGELKHEVKATTSGQRRKND